jgi:anti-sigma factor RsiW
MPVFSDTCSWVQERIEPYVDGELRGPDLDAFERHIEVCETCRRELERAQMVVSGLRALPQQRCPDRVVERAAALLGGAGGGAEVTGGREMGAAWPGRLRRLLGGRIAPVLQPAAAAALVVIIAALFVLFPGERAPFEGGDELSEEQAALDVTQRELELAKLDVMLAFAYVNKYNRLGAEIAAKEGITDPVLKGIERSVVDPLFPFPLHE